MISFLFLDTGGSLPKAVYLYFLYLSNFRSLATILHKLHSILIPFLLNLHSCSFLVCSLMPDHRQHIFTVLWYLNHCIAVASFLKCTFLFIYFGLGDLSLIELFLIRCQYNFFKKAVTFHHDKFEKFLLSFFTFYINNDLPAVRGSHNCTIYFLNKYQQLLMQYILHL